MEDDDGSADRTDADEEGEATPPFGRSNGAVTELPAISLE
jgi:hypothetical protein